MALNHSPSIVTNGLVFAYDMANTQKSWKGAPTTNLLAYSDSLNGGLWSGYCGGTSNVTYKTTDIVAPDGSYNATKLVMDGSTGCGAGAAWGLLYGQSAIFTSGQTYTVSIWARCSTGTVTTTMTLGMNDSFGVGITLTTTWQRFSYTATITGNLDRGLQFIRGDSTIGKTIYVWGAQCEQNSFATPYISSPTSSTTRTNTQAIVDLTNNNTITATNLTYNSDGTFSFNGSNSLLSLPSLNLQRDFTLECWVYLTSSGVDVGFFGQGVYTTNQGLHIGWFPGRGLLFGMYANDLECPGYTMTYNTWHHFVYTYNNSTYFRQTFADGVLVASGTLNVYSGSGQFNVGAIYSSGTTSFAGNYAVAKAYSRVLTAAEVQQNFNALRGRYGL